MQEFDELLSDYNAAVLDKRRSSRWKRRLSFSEPPHGARACSCRAPTRVGDAVDAAIGTVATRYTQPSEWLPGDMGAAALIIEARNKIRGY